VRTAARPPAASLDDNPAGSRELIDWLEQMQPQDAGFDVCVLQLAACLLLHLDAEQLMRTADAAMHRAKHEKSGCAFCDSRTGS